MKRPRRKPRPKEHLQTSKEPFFKKVQTKIAIGKADDPYEREADAVADRVVSGSASKSNKQNETVSKQISPLAQRSVEEETQAKLQRQEEEEAAQAKLQRQEKEEAAQTKIQPQEEEEAAQAKIQRQEEEEAAQAKIQRQEEEEAAQPKLQKMEEEEAQAKLQRQEEEEAAQTKLQRQEEEEAQAKLQGKNAQGNTVGQKMQQTLSDKKGRGQKMEPNVRNEMEGSFGADFSHVNIHTDSQAREMNKEVGAQAFAYGNDIYFNQGKYDPHSTRGKHLLAHELTHTIQQKGRVERKVQRKGNAWRYTPPKVVTRSIKQIQMIVGATPDGVYGPKTREAVIRYQKKLKSLKKYNDTIDGKWGKNTEAAHVWMAMMRDFSSGGYNCAGFVLKTWDFVGLSKTKKIYSGFTKLSNPSKKCKPFHYKIWLWEMDVVQIDTKLKAKSKPWKDFHTVGGRTFKDGRDPDQVMSKNGPRPLEGPGTPLSFEPKTGPVIDKTGAIKPHNFWILSNKKLTAYCTDKLP